MNPSFTGGSLSVGKFQDNQVERGKRNLRTLSPREEFQDNQVESSSTDGGNFTMGQGFKIIRWRGKAVQQYLQVFLQS